MKSDYSCYTDGGCRLKKKIGAWAYAVYDNFNNANNLIETKAGYEQNTTNNIMEMTAMIRLFDCLLDNELSNKTINIYSDSIYLLNGIAPEYTTLSDLVLHTRTRWIDRWKCTNWKTALSSDVKNKLLWIEMDEKLTELLKTNKINFFHVIAHSKDNAIEGNDLVDKLCNDEMDKFLK